jgi:hypothetical protein
MSIVFRVGLNLSAREASKIDTPLAVAAPAKPTHARYGSKLLPRVLIAPPASTAAALLVATVESQL